MNELRRDVNVVMREDGLINLYIYYPIYNEIFYSNYSDEFRVAQKSVIDFVKWTNASIGETCMQLRLMPTTYYCGIEGDSRFRHLCFYGWTPAQYMMMKLAWQYVEVELNTDVDEENRFPLDPHKFINPIFLEPEHIVDIVERVE